jgi:glycine amidinotransferase
MFALTSKFDARTIYSLSSSPHPLNLALTQGEEAPLGSAPISLAERVGGAVVSSYTEWDPLEEVVVGRLGDGVFPTWQDSMYATMPESSWRVFQARGGSPLPSEQLLAAERELDAFADRLDREGVTVVRPDPVDHRRSYATPNWTCKGGLYSAMPRDMLIVVGDIIIEAPMSWRCRQYEVDAYRPLIKSYFRRGARWLPAPRPQLTDELYDADYDPDEPGSSAITEFEPVFDAADFVRFGRDILVQKSHVTNISGIRWLQQAVGDGFRVRVVDVDDPHAMHIDATITPLAPGRLLVNPERYIHTELFEDWEILEAPEPTLPASWPMYFCSRWLSVNVLSLDEETVVVERHEQPLIDTLTHCGFDCIPVDFRHVYSFGGSFHCVTLDVRRQGGLRSYL